MCNVGRDPGAGVETDGLGLHPSVDGAKNPHRLRHSRAVDLPLFPDGEHVTIDIALDRAIDLDFAMLAG